MNEKIDAPAKKLYYYYMLTALAVGIICALAVSLAVGYGLSAAFKSGNGVNAKIGMEVGEGLSKLIGFFFVVKMMFQVRSAGIKNFLSPPTLVFLVITLQPHALCS